MNENELEHIKLRVTKGKYTTQDVMDLVEAVQFYQTQCSKVYDHITGGVLSYPDYYASEVISASDNLMQKILDQIEQENEAEFQKKVARMKARREFG